jgi:hypothetical protein
MWGQQKFIRYENKKNYQDGNYNYVFSPLKLPAIPARFFQRKTGDVAEIIICYLSI